MKVRPERKWINLFFLSFFCLVRKKRESTNLLLASSPLFCSFLVFHPSSENKKDLSWPGAYQFCSYTTIYNMSVHGCTRTGRPCLLLTFSIIFSIVFYFCLLRMKKRAHISSAFSLVHFMMLTHIFFLSCVMVVFSPFPNVISSIRIRVELEQRFHQNFVCKSTDKYTTTLEKSFLIFNKIMNFGVKVYLAKIRMRTFHQNRFWKAYCILLFHKNLLIWCN